MHADIPASRVVAGVRVGLLPDLGFVVNPTIEQMESSTLDLMIAGAQSSERFARLHLGWLSIPSGACQEYGRIPSQGNIGPMYCRYCECGAHDRGLLRLPDRGSDAGGNHLKQHAFALSLGRCMHPTLLLLSGSACWLGP